MGKKVGNGLSQRVDQRCPNLEVGPAKALTLPRSVAQWPEAAFAEYWGRVGMMMDGNERLEEGACRQAEEEVRVMVRMGRLDAWGE